MKKMIIKVFMLINWEEEEHIHNLFKVTQILIYLSTVII